MKNLLLIFCFFLSLSAHSEYKIEDGFIVYTAPTDVEYFSVLGVEQGDSIARGNHVQFSLSQRATFRNEQFKESFVPAAEIPNISGIVGLSIPKELIASSILYQYFSENMSVCRLLLQASADNRELKRFISKAKDMRFDVKARRTHFSIEC